MLSVSSPIHVSALSLLLSWLQIETCISLSSNSLVILRDVTHDGRTVFAPQNLIHKDLEFVELDLAWCLWLDLRNHSLQFLVSHVLALSAEALFQVGFCDVARVVDIEVMEGEDHVSVGDGLSAVDSDGEEFSVVDLTVVVEVNPLENTVNLLLTQIQIIESSPDLGKCKSS